VGKAGCATTVALVAHVMLDVSQMWRMIYIAAQSIRDDQSALNPWRLIRNDRSIPNAMISNDSETPSIDRDRLEFLNITSMDERLMLTPLHAMAQK
jgi:hypothetical protein